MKQGTFEKEIFIRSDAATVINVIADYSNHHKIHPLIIKVERASEEPDGVRRYFITDSLQWGPFKFKTKYQADVISVTGDTVHTEAYPSLNTSVTNITKIIPKDNGIVLHETITISTPNIFFNYVLRQAKSSHAEMLKRIKEFVESTDKS
ncbi:MAG TPA: hypothetical protein VJ972_15690 [Anaerolineales bacterium]|nr:hypothetical protein [Anaerolineales bacterium]